MKLSKILFAALIVLSSTATFAQGDDEKDTHTVTIGIPEIALLDLEAPLNNTAIKLDATHSGEAGDPINFTNATDATLWLNYSSIISAGKSRNVSVEITDGELPGGLDLNVIASGSSTGKGNLGTSNGSITLTDGPQTIITGVGSAYTETGEGKGHNLTYSLSLKSGSKDTYGDLAVKSTTLEITYTLIDNN